MRAAMTDATRTVQAPGGRLRVRTAVVEVIEGADAGTAASINVPVFVVGSDAEAQLRLQDPAVSRQHLRLLPTPVGIELRDGGSKNGTWIGNVRVTQATLTAATVVRVGKSKISVSPNPEATELDLSNNIAFGSAIGVSPAMRHLFASLERMAATQMPVLLEGESGVGKELVARALHTESRRREGPFVAVDCGAIPQGLIEAELFGYAKGAFTGAHTSRVGMFEAADGGTLFLDEIGNLPKDLQPKLLRALDQREVMPLGASKSHSVDVRLISATNRSLLDAVSEGEFRQDLYYRLAVARVTIPPLRDRREDVLHLARAFLREATDDASADVPADLGQLLESYHWPGNVRELRNVVDRYALLGARDPGALFDASPKAAFRSDADLLELPYHEARERVVARFDSDYVTRLLNRAGNVMTRAAELAKISRPTLYRMVERAGRSAE